MENFFHPEETKHVFKVNRFVALIDPNKNSLFDARLKSGVRPQTTQLSRELQLIGALYNDRRKKLLRETIRQDIENERKLLNEVEKDFLQTQP